MTTLAGISPLVDELVVILVPLLITASSAVIVTSPAFASVGVAPSAVIVSLAISVPSVSSSLDTSISICPASPEPVELEDICPPASMSSSSSIDISPAGNAPLVVRLMTEPSPRVRAVLSVIATFPLIEPPELAPEAVEISDSLPSAPPNKIDSLRVTVTVPGDPLPSELEVTTPPSETVSVPRSTNSPLALSTALSIVTRPAFPVLPSDALLLTLLSITDISPELISIFPASPVSVVDVETVLSASVTSLTLIVMLPASPECEVLLAISLSSTSNSAAVITISPRPASGVLLVLVLVEISLPPDTVIFSATVSSTTPASALTVSSVDVVSLSILLPSKRVRFSASTTTNPALPSSAELDEISLCASSRASPITVMFISPASPRPLLLVEISPPFRSSTSSVKLILPPSPASLS